MADCLGVTWEAAAVPQPKEFISEANVEDICSDAIDTFRDYDAGISALLEAELARGLSYEAFNINGRAPLKDISIRLLKEINEFKMAYIDTLPNVLRVDCYNHMKAEADALYKKVFDEYNRRLSLLDNSIQKYNNNLGKNVTKTVTNPDGTKETKTEWDSNYYSRVSKSAHSTADLGLVKYMLSTPYRPKDEYGNLKAEADQLAQFFDVYVINATALKKKCDALPVNAVPSTPDFDAIHAQNSSQNPYATPVKPKIGSPMGNANKYSLKDMTVDSFRTTLNTLQGDYDKVNQAISTTKVELAKLRFAHGNNLVSDADFYSTEDTYKQRLTDLFAAGISMNVALNAMKSIDMQIPAETDGKTNLPTTDAQIQLLQNQLGSTANLDDATIVNSQKVNAQTIQAAKVFYENSNLSECVKELENGNYAIDMTLYNKAVNGAKVTDASFKADYTPNYSNMIDQDGNVYTSVTDTTNLTNVQTVKISDQDYNYTTDNVEKIISPSVPAGAPVGDLPPAPETTSTAQGGFSSGEREIISKVGDEFKAAGGEIASAFSRIKDETRPSERPYTNDGFVEV